MSQANARIRSAEETPVDDVRRVRERLDREAGGDVRALAQESRRVSDELLKKLGLRRAPSSEAEK
jgi:hypothetical protein